MRSLLILNPNAGRPKRQRTEEKIKEVFNRYEVECEVVLTERPGDGTSFAKKAADDGLDVVVAAGGDGTVNEVVNGIVGSQTALGILPMGTVNVLARELQIPLRMRAAIRNIAQGNRHRIDLCQANGRYFALMAGLGFDAEVVANVLQSIKNWIGSSAYILKGLATLATYRATEFTLEMAEETIYTSAFLVIVANASTYSYDLKIAPLAVPDDGLLDICVFEGPIADRMGFANQVARVFANRHLYHKSVRYFRTTSVTIKSDPNVLVQLDGDAFGKTPLEVTIHPRILPVIVPPDVRVER